MVKKHYKTLKATIYLYVPQDNHPKAMEYFAKNPMNGRIIVNDENGKPLTTKSVAGNINTLLDFLFRSWSQRVKKQIRESKKLQK